MKKLIIVLKIVTDRLIITTVLRIMFPGDLHRPPGVRVAAIRLPGVQAVVTALPGVRVVPPGAQ